MIGTCVNCFHLHFIIIVALCLNDQCYDSTVLIYCTHMDSSDALFTWDNYHLYTQGVWLWPLNGLSTLNLIVSASVQHNQHYIVALGMTDKPTETPHHDERYYISIVIIEL